MDVADTKPLEKCCSKCGITKLDSLFIPKRNICKECRNISSREKYSLIQINNDTEQKCNTCELVKALSLFVKNRKICIDCNNNKRRTKYETDEEHRIKMIQQSTDFKQRKIVEKNKIKKQFSTLLNYSSNFNDELNVERVINNEYYNIKSNLHIMTSSLNNDIDFTYDATTNSLNLSNY